MKPLIWVEAQIERHSRSRIEITVKSRSQFKERRYGFNNVLSIAQSCLLHYFSLCLSVNCTLSKLSAYRVQFCSTATNVEIELPVPADATNPNIRTSMGSAAYAPEKDALVWKIKSFPGGKVTSRDIKLPFYAIPLIQ